MSLDVLRYAVLFIVLATAVAAAGGVLARWLPADPGRFRWLARWVLGSAYWMTGLFVLAASGHLSRPGLALAAAPLAVLAVLGRHRGGSRSSPVRRRWPALDLWGGVLLAIFVALVFVNTVSPVVEWDSAVYHLALSKLYLADGGFRPVEMNVYSNWPLGTEMLFSAAMLVADYRLAKTVHLGYGLLVIATLFLAARELLPAPRRHLASWLAVTLFLANDVVGFLMPTAYVDLAHAFFFLAGFLFLHLALDAATPRETATFLVLSGVACGAMAAVKVTGIAWAALVGVFWVPRLVREWRTWLTHFVPPVLALWVPWLVKAAWFTGNPVYPFLHGVFGGPDWSPRLGELFAAWQSSIGMGREPFDWLLLPVRVILYGRRSMAYFEGRISPFWLVLVPLAVGWIWAARRAAPSTSRRLVRRTLVLTGLTFVLWASSSQQMRFLLPTLALLALLAGNALADLVERRAPRWRRPALLVAWLWVAVAQYPYLAPAIRGLPPESVVPEHVRFINASLPPDARILFMNDNQRFFCDHDVLADSFFEASQIGDWLGDAGSSSEVRRRLDERGVTHVLYNRVRWVAWPEAVDQLLDDPEQLEVVFTSYDDHHLVMRLRD